MLTSSQPGHIGLPPNKEGGKGKNSCLPFKHQIKSDYQLVHMAGFKPPSNQFKFVMLLTRELGKNPENPRLGYDCAILVVLAWFPVQF